MGSTATKLAKQDNSRRDQLVLEYLPLVTSIAVRTHETLPLHVDLDDLIHAGVMGLFDAASKYDSNQKVAFPAYAKHRIKGSILDSLRDMDWASRDLRKRHKQLEAAKRDLTERLHREPTDAEIAAEMGITPRRLRSLMVDLQHVTGMAHSQPAERDDQPVPEVPCSAEQHPDRVFAKSQLRATLGAAMQSLPARYQQVVSLYYDRDLTMKEIGQILGVNESRVSQIHKLALERMQVALGHSGVASAAAFQ